MTITLSVEDLRAFEKAVHKHAVEENVAYWKEVRNILAELEAISRSMQYGSGESQKYTFSKLRELARNLPGGQWKNNPPGILQVLGLA